MSVQLEKPKSLIDLSTCAVLVSVRTSVWTGVMTDDEISDEIITNKKADRGAGKFSKSLLTGVAEHKKLVNHRQTVRNWLKRRTYPWAGNWEILPTANLPAFMEEYKQLEDDFAKLREEFLSAYPGKVSDMAFKLNGMFKREEYPTADQLRDRFNMALYTAEVPQGDFRVQVSRDLADDLTKHFNRQAVSVIEGMADRQLNQLAEVMHSISSTCSITMTTQDDGSVKVSRGRLHTETIKKAIQYCDTFKQCNPAGSTKLDAVRAELERALKSIDIDDLKKNDATRAAVKSDVDSILSKFGL